MDQDENLNLEEEYKIGSISWLIKQLKKLPKESFVTSIGEFGYVKGDEFNNEIIIKLYVPNKESIRL